MKLGKELLNTSNVNKNGRKGQPQKGVDVWGYRDRKIDHPVGIQCKLKGPGKELSESEVREEWEKALTFHQEIKEFFILTTADNDVKIEELARTLSLELLKGTGRSVEFYIWGWERICDEIIDYPHLIKAFDPDYGPYSREHSEKIEDLRDSQGITHVKIDSLTEMVRRIGAAANIEGLDSTSGNSEVDKVLDRQIDDYRSILQDGRPLTALSLFEKMLSDVRGSASGRIAFRITANIGACHLALEHIEKGCEYLVAAYEHAPEEPKAISNKALAHLLSGDFPAVLELGKEHYGPDLADEGLWAHVIQAAGRTGFAGDPVSLVPVRHRETEGVIVASVHFERGRENPVWITKAAHAFTLFPDNRYAKHFYADSILEQVSHAEDGWKKGAVPSADRDRLAHAADLYLGIWHDATKGENVVSHDDYVILANLLVALRLLNRHADAIALIEKERDHILRDQDTLIRAVIAAYEAGSSIADDLLPLLPDSSDASMLRIQLALRRADWVGLADIDEAVIDTLNEPEQIVCRTALQLCRAWKASEGAPTTSELDPIIDSVGANPRASILAADMAMAFGVPLSAEKAWLNGRRSITPESHWTSRITVAKHAFRLQRWRDAADLFHRSIDLDADSEELRQLAVAVASELPQSGRGARFFQNLPADIRKDIFYRYYEAVMLFNSGDMRKAEKAARSVMEETRQLDAFRLLSLVFRRSGRPEKVKGILNSHDILSFEGSPGDRMYAAQVLHEVGRIPEALAEMYRLYRAHRDRPEIALSFFVMMMQERTYQHVPRPRRVELDTWVFAQDDVGHDYKFIVGEDASAADDILPPSHPYVQGALGKEVGETFARPRDMGGEVVWTVREIRHRYSQAAHDIGQNSETRFPDAKGVYSYAMKDDDIQPMLDVVRRQAEVNKRFAEQYAGGLPLSFIAGRLNRDPVGLAEYIRSVGEDIRTCLGNAQERMHGFAVIQQHRASGAVLDTYTAWTAAILDLLPVLEELFGSLYIPQSVKDDILLLRGFDQPSEKSMSLVFHDGQYLRHETTPEEAAQRRKFIHDQLRKIEKICQIVPVSAPDIAGEAIVERTEILEMAVDKFGSGVLDPAAIAANGCVLVSEDMNYRQFAGTVWPINSIWLQPALSFALIDGLLTLEEYAAKLVDLAALRHGFVSIDPTVLIETLRTGEETAIMRFEAAASFLGTPTADMNSHVGVATRFIEAVLVQEDIPYLIRIKSISIVLDKLIRNSSGRHEKILVGVLMGCDDEAQRVVAGWIQGHCMVPEVESWYREYCQRAVPYLIRRIISADRSLIGNLQRLMTLRPPNVVDRFLAKEKNKHTIANASAA